MSQKPSTFTVSDPYCLVGSQWRNTETETIARNVVLIQQMMNPEEWTPFTWEQYTKLCKHQVTDAERGVLEALTKGGRPVWKTSADLQAGYLTKDSEGCYAVTPKFLEVVSACLEK
jgi:hypothetical protein